MLAARQQDPEALAAAIRSRSPRSSSTIDGLQPEKGHETLYVVRELTQKRVWFAEPLLSATADEVRRLIAKAKEWAESLGMTVGLWMSDKQDAFVTGIAAEFPDVPHRYCDNHFLRDVAKPVLEADSHAKVQMRKQGARPAEDRTSRARAAEAARGAGNLADRDDPARRPTRRRADGRTRRRRRRPIRPAAWSWTIARRCAGSSTTIRAGRCILPACGWPRRWTRSGVAPTEPGREKRGFAESNSAAWPDASRAAWTKSRNSKRSIREYVEVDRGGGRDPRTRDGGLRGAPGEVRGVDRSLRGDRGPDPSRTWPR